MTGQIPLCLRAVFVNGAVSEKGLVVNGKKIVNHVELRKKDGSQKQFLLLD